MQQESSMDFESRFARVLNNPAFNNEPQEVQEDFLFKSFYMSGMSGRDFDALLKRIWKDSPNSSDVKYYGHSKQLYPWSYVHGFSNEYVRLRSQMEPENRIYTSMLHDQATEAWNAGLRDPRINHGRQVNPEQISYPVDIVDLDSQRPLPWKFYAPIGGYRPIAMKGEKFFYLAPDRENHIVEWISKTANNEIAYDIPLWASNNANRGLWPIHEVGISDRAKAEKAAQRSIAKYGQVKIGGPYNYKDLTFDEVPPFKHPGTYFKEENSGIIDPYVR